MKFMFDKSQPRLTVSEIPAEATKVTFTIPEQSLSLTGNPIEIGNFSFSLVGTLLAIREEEVTTERDVLDEQGNVIDTETIVSTESSVLESQSIDLKVL